MKKLIDLANELFLAIPPKYLNKVGEWNSLLVFLERNEIGNVEVPMLHEGD